LHEGGQAFIFSSNSFFYLPLPSVTFHCLPRVQGQAALSSIRWIRPRLSPPNPTGLDRLWGTIGASLFAGDGPGEAARARGRSEPDGCSGHSRGRLARELMAVNILLIISIVALVGTGGPWASEGPLPGSNPAFACFSRDFVSTESTESTEAYRLLRRPRRNGGVRKRMAWKERRRVGGKTRPPEGLR
jgi:hypothetical protein